MEDNTSWNKVLKLTKCEYPAILKYGNDWLNYNFSFETKIPAITDKDFPKEHQNFTFVVRARDKGNGVFFQCKPDGTIRPHLLTNGLFIVDDTNTIKFLAEFPIEKWIPVRIEVNGDNVVINIFSVSATYKIPSARLLLPSNEVRSVMTLDKVLKLTDENKHPDTSKNPTSSEPKLAFDLDYEKGTVGFRESGKETAMFRKIKIELLQPIYK
ncbi:hypothetical protein COS78_00940 [Candidatus Shapirobacteria bacterium CG06_land_8_20_14_3_00_40_12]|uniref:Uncharacterized protein n=2 Tax=Candidatus Shapironibacteriota TaxID=1752721 RepID=A0A2M7TRT1_9BACT|nr:MAG: hypothetical protein COS78_00940 [Candidatus Shapirobacteria bacterium CG06_land_8_20_14_3_00_40_12]PIZ58185.1 MAG: hypothetical protein COY20_04005 [Candidatus Shapirobacteria bacterium CG_4_10_14_0_2_um_filter_40_12]